MDFLQPAYVFVQLLQCETFHNEIAQKKPWRCQYWLKVVWNLKPDKEGEHKNRCRLLHLNYVHFSLKKHGDVDGLTVVLFYGRIQLAWGRTDDKSNGGKQDGELGYW
jgi:hypothetical protein